MPQPTNITKAFLEPITWDSTGKAITVHDDPDMPKKIQVQFNPESLKIAFSNQLAGQNNRGGSAIQFASRGTTKLSFEMWFDVTAQHHSNQQGAQHHQAPAQAHQTQAGQNAQPQPAIDDVRRLTAQIAAFMKTKKSGSGEKAKYTPPGCRFQWGTFLFEGVMESINETLEFFSEQGKPLRASVSVSLTKQDVEVTFPPQPPATQTAGTHPQQQARAGDSVQSMSAREGHPHDWQERAIANDVEDPIRVALGTLLRSMNA